VNRGGLRITSFDRFRWNRAHPEIPPFRAKRTHIERRVRRVLFVQQQPCIRALKYAVGLRLARPELELGFAYRGDTLSGWYGAGDELFDRWWKLNSRPEFELRQIVEEFRPDVVHSHNLPDELTVAALGVVDGRVPVVHDVHDLQSLRRTPYEDGFPEPSDPLELEKLAVEGSAGLVVVSDELLEAIRAQHTLPARTLVFPNFALRRDLPERLPARDVNGRRLSSIVYQGTLATNGGHYDLRDLFTALAEAEVTLDIHCAREVSEYRRLAEQLPRVTYHAPLRPTEVLRVLPRYDYGWAGFNDGLNAAHLDTALPNKVFEYLGCGLPVITLGHVAIKRFIEEHGVGIALDSVDELDARLVDEDLPSLRMRVEQLRPKLTVEANIRRLTDFYEALAG
jgi:glycosyltransferase involved in cell wall biosynthesis